MIPEIEIEYKIVQPEERLFNYVKYFWKLSNTTADEKPVTIVPDGFFDVLFTMSSIEPFNVMLMGIGTKPSQSFIQPHSIIVGISFKLLSAEYILGKSLASFPDGVNDLPVNFLDMRQDDLNNFEAFCKKASHNLINRLTADVDNRRLELFQLIYTTNGSATIKEIAEKVYWSSRQINRYFNQWFGLSLKAYCNILRYRASFDQIKEGKLFPEQDFADQAHFIKDVKKYSGVTPKELAKNKDDRFIQFSTLPKK
jgi:AraC-like DNA-binding protein